MLTFAVKKKRTPSIALKRHAPTMSPMSHSLHLQQAKVRHILRSLTLQPKLTIGQPNDKYEQEADTVAEQVMRMPEPRLQRQVEPEEEEEETLQPKPLVSQITPLVQVQRQEEPEEEEEELQAKPLTEQITPLVQRQVEPEEEEEEEAIQTKLADGMQVQRQEEPEEEEEEEPVQTKQVSTRAPAVTPNLASRIQSLRGGGQPLSESTRAFFEPRFGHDFSQVRTHKDSHSSQMNQTLNAKAFTDKKDIYYGTGNYPGNNALTAHELTHVVQQTNGNPLSSKLNRQPKIKAINSRNTVQRANSFESFGSGVKRTLTIPFGRTKITLPRKITRFKQVLQNYGMTCLSTSIMYMIQSYGLVPPNMTREEFEYAFTPLNPYNPSSPLPKTPDIKVGGQQQREVKAVDLFTKALTGRDKPSTYRCGRYGKLTKAEMTLRGIKGGYFGSTVMRKMPSILAAFEEQSREPGYGFMKAYRPVSGGAYPRKTPETPERWFNCYSQLNDGTILANYANYFQKGNTILVPVYYLFPPKNLTKHWVVIVKDKKHTITLGGRNYHLYPADDPLGSQIYIMVPFPQGQAIKTIKQQAIKRYSNGTKTTPNSGKINFVLRQRKIDNKWLLYYKRNNKEKEIDTLVKMTAYCRERGMLR